MCITHPEIKLRTENSTTNNKTYRNSKMVSDLTILLGVISENKLNNRTLSRHELPVSTLSSFLDFRSSSCTRKPCITSSTASARLFAFACSSASFCNKYSFNNQSVHNQPCSFQLQRWSINLFINHKLNSELHSPTFLLLQSKYRTYVCLGVGSDSLTS